jgi:hypothetical protein
MSARIVALIVALISLCTACEEQKVKIVVTPSPPVTIVYVGEPTTFGGRAEVVSLECYCERDDSSTCAGPYDGEICREGEREEVEIERVEMSGGGGDCTVEVHVNDDEVSYSGIITCTRTGSVFLTVTVTTDDGAGSGRQGFEVRTR